MYLGLRKHLRFECHGRTLQRICEAPLRLLKGGERPAQAHLRQRDLDTRLVPEVCGARPSQREHIQVRDASPSRRWLEDPDPKIRLGDRRQAVGPPRAPGGEQPVLSVAASGCHPDTEFSPQAWGHVYIGTLSPGMYFPGPPPGDDFINPDEFIVNVITPKREQLLRAHSQLNEQANDEVVPAG